MVSEGSAEGGSMGGRSGWHWFVILPLWAGLMVAWVGPPVLTLWLLRGWLERQGLSADLAVVVALTLGCVPGVLVGWMTGLTRPSRDPEVRRQALGRISALRATAGLLKLKEACNG